LYFFSLKSRAEIMAKTDVSFTNDAIKERVRDRREAKKRGEGYETLDPEWFKGKTTKTL
jgi:hypothetical protein